jgi:hypothetical protein
MHSTVTVLLETTNRWSINIDNALLNGVVFIDLKKLSILLITQFFWTKLLNTGLMKTH